MSNPAGINGVCQGAHQRFLANQFGKGRGPILSGKDAVVGVAVCCHELVSPVMRSRIPWSAVPGGATAKSPKAGDRNDPGGNSLRLLPSGPDRVGETPVRPISHPLYRLCEQNAQA